MVKYDYSKYVGLVKERNRPSGGIKTVHEVIKNSFIDKDSKILEIGSNTGFTSVNLSLLSKCNVVGIDYNENSVNESKKYAKENHVEDKVTFKLASAEELPFKDQEFDAVWCSNVTSFIKDKEKALSEYFRVLDYNGLLILIPIYYIKEPPKDLVDKVSAAIDSKIEVWDKTFWKELIHNVSQNCGFELEQVYDSDYTYLNVESQIPSYLEEVFSKDELQKMDSSELEILKKDGKYFMELFNENLKYCGYSIMIFQKRYVKEEVELYLSKKK